MSFTHTQSQLCTTAPVSPFIQRSDLTFAIDSRNLKHEKNGKIISNDKISPDPIACQGLPIHVSYILKSNFLFAMH